jgi:hypothetical protein
MAMNRKVDKKGWNSKRGKVKAKTDEARLQRINEKKSL